MATTPVLHFRLEKDLQTLVQGMNLQSVSGLTSAIGKRVVVQNLLERLHVKDFPAVLITAQALSEEEEDGSFEEDFVVYPVLLLICDIARPDLQTNQRRQDYLTWRHAIARKLRGLVNYPLLPSVPELHTIKVRDMPILPDGMEVKQYVQSGIVALCHTNELRERGGATPTT